jgi:hypothetical protein
MSIEEKVREIMLSEELSESEKLDRLHSLIPAEEFKIDNLSKATPAQLRKLKDGLAVTQAMQQIRRAELLAKKQNESRIAAVKLEPPGITDTTSPCPFADRARVGDRSVSCRFDSVAVERRLSSASGLD